MYAARDENRSEHLAELLPRMGMEQFAATHYRSLTAWLEPIALQTTRGLVLARAAVEELRKRRTVLPPVAVIERLCAEAETSAQRKVFSLLTDGLDTQRRTKLDGLLEPREGSPYSSLAWLRSPPGPPTARTILAHIERLGVIGEIGRSAEAGLRVHQNRLLQIAREAGQTAVYQLKE